MKKFFTILFVFAIVANINAQSPGKIVFTTNKPLASADPNGKVGIAVNAAAADQAGVWVDANNNQVREAPAENPNAFGSWDIKDYSVGSKTMTINGNITELRAEWGEITSMDFSQSNLQLTIISLKINSISGVNATNLVNSLPDRTGHDQGRLSIIDTSNPSEGNVLTTTDVAIAVAKNWAIIAWNGTGEEDYLGTEPIAVGKINLTTLKPTIAEDANSKIGIGFNASASEQAGVWVDANNNQVRDEPTENPQNFQLWMLNDFPVGSQTMTINGNIAEVTVKWADVSAMDFSESNLLLKKIEVFSNKINGVNATSLMNSLPDRTGETAGTIIVFDETFEWEENQFTTSDVAIATGKNWNVLAKNSTGAEVNYPGITTGLNDNKKLNFDLQIQNNTVLLSNMESGLPVSVFNMMGQTIYSKLSTSTMQIELPKGIYILKVANDTFKINTGN